VYWAAGESAFYNRFFNKFSVAGGNEEANTGLRWDRRGVNDETERDTVRHWPTKVQNQPLAIIPGK